MRGEALSSGEQLPMGMLSPAVLSFLETGQRKMMSAKSRAEGLQAGWRRERELNMPSRCRRPVS